MVIGQTGDSSSLLGISNSTIGASTPGQGGVTKETLESVRDDLQTSGLSTKNLDDIIDNYDSIDLNGDGISAGEYNTYKKTQLKGDFADKSFTKDELGDLRDKMAQSSGQANPGLDAVIKNFDVADANQDGSVSMDEMKAYAKANGLTLFPPTAGDSADGTGSTGSASSADLDEQLQELLNQASANDPLLTGSDDSEDGSAADGVDDQTGVTGTDGSAQGSASQQLAALLNGSSLNDPLISGTDSSSSSDPLASLLGASGGADTQGTEQQLEALLSGSSQGDPLISGTNSNSAADPLAALAALGIS